jgi:hypothetical protein
VADRYASMTTAQLEEDAAGRRPPVDLGGATTNAQRAELLRAADQAGQAAGGGALAGAGEPVAGFQPAPHFDPPPPEPYADEQDLQARLDAASGTSGGVQPAGEPSGIEQQ